MKRLSVSLTVLFVVVSSSVNAAAIVSVAEAVKRAKEAVTRGFRDPLSAQWKNVYLNRKPDGQYVVCGAVNAKNGFGAYVGFRQFYAIVSMEKDPYQAAMSQFKRMQKDAEANLANVGSGKPEAPDIYIDPGDSRAFFEANEKMCVEGKRTYVK